MTLFRSHAPIVPSGSARHQEIVQPPSCLAMNIGRPRRHLQRADRKSTRLNFSHTDIYTLSLHDALPISRTDSPKRLCTTPRDSSAAQLLSDEYRSAAAPFAAGRSEEHTSELQSH